MGYSLISHYTVNQNAHPRSLVPVLRIQHIKRPGAADSKTLGEGARQINTDLGRPGWGGPCPTHGRKPHRYNFTVYALKVDKLELPPNATASLTGFMVNGNALAKASITAKYGR